VLTKLPNGSFVDVCEIVRIVAIEPTKKEDIPGNSWSPSIGKPRVRIDLKGLGSELIVFESKEERDKFTEELANKCNGTPPEKKTYEELAEVLDKCPPTGTRWRHYKNGDTYMVVRCCILESTGEPMVVYRPEHNPLLVNFVRPLAEFLEIFPDGTARFQILP
jgi:hypothetical protein